MAQKRNIYKGSHPLYSMATKKDDSKNVSKELAKENKEIKAENEALRIALSESKSKEKITKEFSDYFCNNENERMTFKNLSETKRYFEINHSDLLKTACEKLKVDYLTSKQFHSMLHTLTEE